MKPHIGDITRDNNAHLEAHVTIMSVAEQLPLFNA